MNAVIGTAFINFVVSGAIGWLNANGARHVSVWSIPLLQRTSVFTDAIGTFFLLPLITGLLCTMAVRIEQTRRGLPMITLPYPAMAKRIPRQPLRRGAALGIASLIAFAPLAALVIVLAGVRDLSPTEFVLYAALLAVALGLVVTPVVALLAMADQASNPVTIGGTRSIPR